MTEVTLPYTLADGQKAYAARLMANLNALMEGINIAVAAAEYAAGVAEYWEGREERLADGTAFLPAITELTTEDNIADGDYVPFYDISAGFTRRSTWENIKSRFAPVYAYGTDDLTAGTSELATGTLYFVYE